MKPYGAELKMEFEGAGGQWPWEHVGPTLNKKSLNVCVKQMGTSNFE